MGRVYERDHSFKKIERAKKVIYLTSRWGNLGSERFSDFPKVTKVINYRLEVNLGLPVQKSTCYAILLHLFKKVYMEIKVMHKQM